MQGMRRRWIVSDLPGDPRESLARRLLRRRAGADERRRRILETPQLTDLHAPGSLPGARAAAEAILRACRDGRRIAVYGDYDVDGISATAILWHLLPSLRPEWRVETFLPHRVEHGYGLNIEALRELRGRGIDTVVTVDCGVTAVAEAEAAASFGLELIVTDHHAIEPGAATESLRLPRAAAIAHPDLPGEAAPFRGLCGAAVAWKVACAVAAAFHGREQVPEPVRRRLVELLPLVALGTIADVMALEDENRIFAALGLRGLASTTIPGLAALVKSEARGRRPDAEQIGYRLGPMLNACGRLGHAAEALELLTSATGRRAEEIVRTLSATNEERKRLERQCADEASREAERLGLTGSDRRAIVLSSPDWHEGVVGIACSRLVERFGRPTVLLQDRGDGAKGSGRSVGGVHLLECLRACPADLFRRLGGHAMAVGLEIDASRVDELRESLIRQVNERMSADDLAGELEVDAEVPLSALSMPAVEELESLEPFGRGNPRPKFLLRGVTLTAPAKPLGGGEHAELWITEPGRTGQARRALWWNAAALAARLPVGAAIDLVADARIDGFRGVREVVLTVQDAGYPDISAGSSSFHAAGIDTDLAGRTPRTTDPWCRFQQSAPQARRLHPDPD